MVLLAPQFTLVPRSKGKGPCLFQGVYILYLYCTFDIELERDLEQPVSAYVVTGRLQRFALHRVDRAVCSR